MSCEARSCPEPDHGDIACVAAKFGLQLGSKRRFIGPITQRSSQPGLRGDLFKGFPIANPLKIGSDQPDAYAILKWQDVQSEQIERSVEGQDASICCEIADIGRAAHQPVAEIQFLDQRSDIRVALEKVVVEVFQMPPATGNDVA